MMVSTLAVFVYIMNKSQTSVLICLAQLHPQQAYFFKNFLFEIEENTFSKNQLRKKQFCFREYQQTKFEKEKP